MTLEELNALDREARAAASRAAQLSAQRDQVVLARNNAKNRLTLIEGEPLYDGRGIIYRSAFYYITASGARDAIEAAAAAFRDDILNLAAADLEARARAELLHAKALQARLESHLSTPEVLP